MGTEAAALVLFNRRAGGGRVAALEPALRTALAALAPRSTMLVTADGAEARAAVAALPQGSRVVAVGGDGTLHQLLPALLAGDHAVGVVPAGSGDDSARAFGLRALPWRDALRHALGAPACAVDVGEVRTEHETRAFVSSLCAGFDAAIAQRAREGPRWLGGLARYLLATLTEIAALSSWHVRVRIDGRTLHDGDALFASAVNTPTYGGGMPIAPAAAIDDGRVDLVVAGRFGRAGALAMLPRLLRGTHLTDSRVHHATFAALRADADRALPLAADGEPMIASRWLEVRVLAQRLRVVQRR